MRIYIFLLTISLLFTSLLYANQTGDVHLYCKPKFRVYLDGDLIGKTNKDDSGIYIRDVSLGQHKIRLMKKRKANEVLTFSVNRALTEIESNKYNIGKFTEEVRNSKLIGEGLGMIPVVAPQDFLGGLFTGSKIYLHVETEESDLYIPGVDEEYVVDSLPKMLTKIIPISFVKDSANTIENDKVWVKGLINPNGAVDSVVIIGSCGNSFYDSMAYDAALVTKFIPAMKDNKLTWMWGTWAIPFESTEGEYLPASDEFVPVEVQPEMIYYSTPNYPRKEKDKKIGGVVWVKALVGKNGIVLKAQLSKSSGIEALDNAAVEAALKNKFKPGIQNSKPVAVWVTYKVDFNLGN